MQTTTTNTVIPLSVRVSRRHQIAATCRTASFQALRYIATFCAK